MSERIEYHGRFCRADGRPANPGSYQFRFALYEGADGSTRVWEETHQGVRVAAGGFYHVLLGAQNPLPEDCFKGEPLWLAVQQIRSSKVGDEVGKRVPLLAQGLRAIEISMRTEKRMDEFETLLRRSGLLPDEGDVESEPWALRVIGLGEELDALALRLGEAEKSGGRQGERQRLQALSDRVEALARLEDRVLNIEDEIEEIVGSEGDLAELTERLDNLAMPRAEADAARANAAHKELATSLLKMEQGLSMAIETLGSLSRRIERFQEEISTLSLAVEALRAHHLDE